MFLYGLEGMGHDYMSSGGSVMKISGDAIGAVLCETLYCRLRLRFAEVRQRVERALVMKYGVVRALRLNAYFADVAPEIGRAHV